VAKERGALESDANRLLTEVPNEISDQVKSHQGERPEVEASERGYKPWASHRQTRVQGTSRFNITSGYRQAALEDRGVREDGTFTLQQRSAFTPKRRLCD